MREVRGIWRMLACLCFGFFLGTAGLAQGQVVPPPMAHTTRAVEERSLVLESIEIEGNKHTKDWIVEGYLELEPGDEITVEVLDAARLRLLSSDYFSDVDLYTRPGTRKGNVVLVVEVEERYFLSFETGFGYDNLQGWYLTLLGLRVDNPIGTESRLRLGWRLGFRVNGIDVDWAKPVRPGGGFGYGARLYAYEEKFLFYGSGPATTWGGTDVSRYRQIVDRAGGELTFDYGEGPTQFTFGVHGESIKPESTFVNVSTEDAFGASDLPADLQTELGRNTITGFLFRTIRDTRDFVPYPLEGSFAFLNMQLNNSWLGGDVIFTKAELDLRKYFDLGHDWASATRLKGGVVSSGAPYYERFYIGGIYSIRGFEELSLSPPSGDEAFWYLNQELRWPLLYTRGQQPRLTGIVFIDAGQGWVQGDVVTADDIRAGAGYGVRLKMPWLGTLGLDIGIPLTDGGTGDPFRVHASLGFSF